MGFVESVKDMFGFGGYDDEYYDDEFDYEEEEVYDEAPRSSALFRQKEQ